MAGSRVLPTERFRGQFIRFPLPLWLLAAANLVLFTARGMTIPFLVIYFGEVVGLGDGRVGAGIAVSSIAGVIFTLILGGWIDRFGPRRLVVITILGTALTTMLFPSAHTVSRFFVVMIVQGLFVQLYWPSSDTLATSLVPVSLAGEMFAVMRVASALGTGLGGLLGGLIAADGTAAEFRLLYLVAGAGIAAAGGLVILLVHPKHVAAVQVAHVPQRGSWMDVFRDRRFMVSQAIMFMLLAGLTQFSVSTPPFLHAHAGLGDTAIGALFTINTIVVVALQIAVARRIAKLGRGVTLAVTGIFWAVAYAMIGASIWVTALPFLAAVVYTLGEMLFMPTSGVIAVELAPDHLRGRYLAFGSIIWGTSWGLAAWIAGLVLSSSRPALLWPALVAMLVATSFAGLLYDRIPAKRQDPVAVSD